LPSRSLFAIVVVSHDASFVHSRILACGARGRRRLRPFVPLEQTPLTQDAVDRFLAGGRDARNYGITTYRDAAGDRFEFANRPHPDQATQLDFVSPKNARLPIVEVASAIADPFPMLLDTSARQSWATLAAVKGLEYRTFAPPTGEFPDHVVAEIPGYAGVATS
jgi:hypothetical protein